MIYSLPDSVQNSLLKGIVIPAHPLALTSDRKLDERRQRALSRYYIAAGAGGLAVGVHTTQFAIRDPQFDLLKPVLQLAAEEMDRADANRSSPLVRIAGICGDTSQAHSEASLAKELGFHAGLLSLAALKDLNESDLLQHCRSISETIPIFGFYLQPAVDGMILPYSFWRQFVEIEGIVAIKIAPFNRYQTLDVIRAVAESGREDIALYTGNDDNIVMDLVTPYSFTVNGSRIEKRMAGGLLGHWSVWTHRAAELLDTCKMFVERRENISSDLLRLNIEVTDSNAAFFDSANGFRGCIAGLHEVLRRQRLLEGVWCLDSAETLSPGQTEEIERVYLAYPHLNDDEFVQAHRDEWLSG